jgi:hypothetical protein
MTKPIGSECSNIAIKNSDQKPSERHNAEVKLKMQLRVHRHTIRKGKKSSEKEEKEKKR